MLAQWDDLVSTKLYLTGGVGSRHYGEAIGDPYELPPDRAYCETCASIASIMWNWRLLLVTGESRFADLIERTLYNGFLAGHSLDGRSFFYANPLQSRGGDARHSWNPVACCPPNIMRLLASLHHYLATDQRRRRSAPSVRDLDDPCGRAGRGPRRARGRDGLSVVGVRDGRGGRVRRRGVDALAPRAGVGTRASVDGAAGRAGRYAELTRRWQAGDRVVLELDVSPRLTAPNPRIDAVRGCVALERGPIVYCFEADRPPGRRRPRRRRAPDGRGACRQRSTGAARRRAGRVRCRASSATSTGGGRPSTSTFASCRRNGAATPARLLAIPYFAWANRGDGGMRVWLPGGRLEKEAAWRPCRSSR